MMGKPYQITIEFKDEMIGLYADSFLAQLHHVCQANPADISDQAAIDAAEAVKAEIVRRWLRSIPVDMFNHQGRHMAAADYEDMDCGK